MKSLIKFNYLYRDAGNYKSWGDILFLNPDGFDLEEIDKRLKMAFDQETLFVAHQINVPEVFLYAEQTLNDNDHCFHEYDSVDLTTRLNSRTDGRSIKQFLEQVELASISGWNVFNPIDQIVEMRKRSHVGKKAK